ncbi:hypothetical protein [uncultured Nostoc sp.]|uniref:hypothetical protein n=1 Tax=uncultured Nostoc sp. TaxID=340711 RepID=UPI0035CC9DD4
MPGGSNIGAGTQLRTSNEIRQQNLGIEFAMRGGQEAIGGELAYELNWYFSGLLNSFFPNSQTSALENSLTSSSAEGGFYTLGKNHAEIIQDAIDNGRKVVDDFRNNPPDFDIPRPKIPKIELPQLPEVKLPELPEFNIPEFKFPEFKDKDKPNPFPKIPRPKPIPKNLTRQLRELELSECGSISFGYARAAKVLGYEGKINEQGGYYEKRIDVPVSIEEVYDAWLKYNLTEGESPTLKGFLESGGQTGQVTTTQINRFTSFNTYYGIGGSINSDQPTRSYPFHDLYFPYYSYGSLQIAVNGINNNSAINAILDNLDSEYPGEVYKINVSQLDAKDCPLGKPPPPPEPPPEPPEDCDCMAKCCPDIDYRKIQKIIESEVKKLDVTAAIPLSFQIRHEGDTPQMVIQCAERKSAASENTLAKYDSAKYPITVPHWKGGQNDKPSLPPYRKGNWEGILVLADNSKVTINAQNEAECTKILNAIKPWIDNKMLSGSYFKGGKIVTEQPIKQALVYPRYGRYFANGQKNNKPDWRVDFP